LQMYFKSYKADFPNILNPFVYHFTPLNGISIDFP